MYHMVIGIILFLALIFKGKGIFLVEVTPIGIIYRLLRRLLGKRRNCLSLLPNRIQI